MSPPFPAQASNVVLNARGRAMLVDFGAAAVCSAPESDGFDGRIRVELFGVAELAAGRGAAVHTAMSGPPLRAPRGAAGRLPT